ncbi:alkaline shock response membrane anchor protein AmaP [Kutzneria sp. NPDC052558]|uniref:alkaline shock response membrane anchor protein AmaP n=1 Tax=Kutzneria sp. NPDC052558 TaxID=3364121 RepID=UPI0037C8E85E
MNRPARLNRTLLALLGIVLLAAGAIAAAAHFARIGPLAPDSAVLPDLGRPPAWTPTAVGAAGVIIGLLALRWLLAQFGRGPKTHTWQHTEESGATTYRPTIAVTPFEDEVAALPGVRSAAADLGGTRDAPTLALLVTAEPDADLRSIRQALAADVLPRLRQALDLDAVAATVEFRFSTTTVRVL